MQYFSTVLPGMQDVRQAFDNRPRGSLWGATEYVFCVLLLLLLLLLLLWLWCMRTISVLLVGVLLGSNGKLVPSQLVA